MPFQIIRNDITKMKTDAIVNTANPKAAVGEGVDSAIYEAAGREKLLKQREQIGEISVGDVAVTSAGKLPCKYIFHASGPYYKDGKHGEPEALRSCYVKSLELAIKHKCKSISFPLLATGFYNFPREEALKIAVSVFSEFLLKYDIDIYLVVFDKESVAVSGKIFSDVAAYIDERYVDEAFDREYFAPYPRALRKRDRYDRNEVRSSLKCIENSEESLDIEDSDDDSSKDVFDSISMPMMAPQAFNVGEESCDESSEKTVRKVAKKESAKKDVAKKDVTKKDITKKESALKKSEKKRLKAENIDDILKQHNSDFTGYLQQLINKKSLTNAEVYKRANLTKQYFSKVMNGKVHPTKPKLLSIAVALKLNMDETIDLLRYGGYAFSPCNKVDIVFEYFITREDYDIYSIDIVLFDAGLPTLMDN